MRCIAKYIGNTEKLGAKPGEIYTVDLNTYSTEHGAPYIWVSANGSSNYIMPFAGVRSMLREWMFLDGQDDDGVQEGVERTWMEMLYPGEAITAQ